jgi:hypothetical protein
MENLWTLKEEVPIMAQGSFNGRLTVEPTNPGLLSQLISLSITITTTTTNGGNNPKVTIVTAMVTAMVIISMRRLVALIKVSKLRWRASSKKTLLMSLFLLQMRLNASKLIKKTMRLFMTS